MSKAPQSLAPQVIISAFGDEGAIHKTALEQFSALSALGLSWYSPRFMDLENNCKIQHVVDMTDAQWKQLAKLNSDYGMNVTSIGARLGKVKLFDIADSSHNKFVPQEQYLKTEVRRTIDAALALGTKFIRGFSYYHPAGEDPKQYLSQAAEQISSIVDAVAKEGLLFGLELEANLVGQTGVILNELAEKINHPNLVLIYDGGNLSSQNMPRQRCIDEYHAMKSHMGWMHIKDYKIDPGLTWTGVVDEERLKNFVPVDIGDSGYPEIFADLKTQLPALTAKLQAMGVPGFFLELEPHLKGGGQFGGFSGPDGLGVACRSLCQNLDELGIGYNLRTMDDIKKSRGF